MPDVSDHAPDAEASLDHPDPLRESGDLDMDIPLHAIDQADFNPKGRIHGVYRRGLSGSLGAFALRDRLKVWPNPRSRGRYVVLDGNQRLDVIKEMIEDHLASLEASRRLAADLEAEEAARDPDLPPAESDQAIRLKRLNKAFDAVKADEPFMAGVRASASSQVIPCRVLADLSPDDAKLFTIAFNRNQSRFDEVKVSSLAAEIQSRSRKLIDRIARPERVLIAPTSIPAPAASPAAQAPQPETPSPAPAGPTEEQPWGPPPPDPEDDGLKPATPWQSGPLAGPRPQMVPKMFQFTPEGAAELDDGLLKSSSRILRVERLKSAVERFLASSPDADLSDLTCEVVLICANRRIDVAAEAEA